MAGWFDAGRLLCCTWLAFAAGAIHIGPALSPITRSSVAAHLKASPVLCFLSARSAWPLVSAHGRFAHASTGMANSYCTPATATQAKPERGRGRGDRDR